MTIIFRLKTLFAPVAIMMLSACGADTGHDRRNLLGEWVQQDAIDSGDGIRVEQVTISYDDDGSSGFSGVMVLAEPDGDAARFDLAAIVDWTLEETVITRTLRSVEVTPATASDAGVAEQIEQAYRQTPPTNLIIQSLDAETLVLLDPSSGDIRTFLRPN